MAAAVLGLGLAAPLLAGWTTVLFGVGLACMVHRWACGMERRIALAKELNRQTGEQLLQSQKLAALGQLMAGVAHEINTPLAVIGQEAELGTHLLIADPPQILEARESLAQIGVQVRRCGDITRRMLDLARQRKPVRQATDLARLVEDMARLVEKEAGRNGIRVERRYEPMPLVSTDPQLLRQVVLNLLNNALQAMEQHGGTMTVSTVLTNDGPTIAVSDSGPGIAAEHLSRIFDPFFTTKEPGLGTGLGLSISQKILAELGGHITVRSEPGRGATFTVMLPG